MPTQRPCSLSCAPDSTLLLLREALALRPVFGWHREELSFAGEHTGWTGLQPFPTVCMGQCSAPKFRLGKHWLDKSENSHLQSRTPTIF